MWMTISSAVILTVSSSVTLAAGCKCPIICYPCPDRILPQDDQLVTAQYDDIDNAVATDIIKSLPAGTKFEINRQDSNRFRATIKDIPQSLVPKD